MREWSTDTLVWLVWYSHLLDFVEAHKDNWKEVKSDIKASPERSGYLRVVLVEYEPHNQHWEEVNQGICHNAEGKPTLEVPLEKSSLVKVEQTEHKHKGV